MGSYINPVDGEWYEGIGDPGAPWRDLTGISGVHGGSAAAQGMVYDTGWTHDDESGFTGFSTGWWWPWDIRLAAGTYKYRPDSPVVQQALATARDYLVRSFAWQWQQEWAARVDGAQRYLGLQAQSGQPWVVIWNAVQGVYGPEAADVAFRNVGLNPPGDGQWTPRHGFAPVATLPAEFVAQAGNAVAPVAATVGVRLVAAQWAA